MTVKVLGLEEIERKLKSLPDKLQQRVLASGNGAVARRVGNVAKKNAAEHKSLSRNIIAENNPKARATKGYIVGVKKPYSSLAHLFEFGTGPRYQKKTGRFTGSMKAEPFLRPALENFTQEEIEAIWTKAASRNLEKQLKSL